MSVVNHTISVAFGGADFFLTTADIKSYQITNDMLAIADSWSIEVPVKPLLWDLAKPDNEVQVHIDDSLVLSGFVDSRIKSEGRIRISGRDRGGRLVDESAPLVEFGGLDIEGLALEIAGEWFSEVRIHNAVNRRLIAGRGAKAKRGREPAVLVGENLRHKVRPGETRAAVLTSILEQAGLMAWSTADGKALIVGRPNQNQAPDWYFFNAKPGSTRAAEANVLELTYGEDLAESFSEITACGSGKGDSVNYGRAVTRRRATVKAEAGVFVRPKRLLVSDPDVRSPAEARRRAEREMRERAAGAVFLELTVPGHGQRDPRIGWPAIYGFDTVARVEDEEIGLAGDFYVTSVTFTGSAETSRTDLELVPVGTDLRVNG